MPEIHFKYQQLVWQALSEADQQLSKSAVEALNGSYSPYSKFKVGAAIKLQNGLIITGANQENSAYSCGICAERAALYNAQSIYPNLKVEAIAIAAQIHDSAEIEATISPCGLCRQALAEVENRQASPIRVLMVGCKEIIVVDSVSDLLPFAFKF